MHCRMYDQVYWYHYHHSKFHCTTQSTIMSYISHSTMSNITRSTTSNDSSSPSSFAASFVRVVPPAIPNPIKGAVGAATFLQAHASQAAAIATAAANNAAAVNTAHAIIIEKHCTMFLQQAFDINPNGMAIMDKALLPDCVKKYKSVKTVSQYNDMVWCLTH